MNRFKGQYYMDGTSLTPEQEKLNALRQILPEAFSEGKIDWEKLKATLGEDINFSNERYVLNWAGKSDAFKVLQTPTTKTLIPAKDESVNFDQTENIFIEGENLEVLKVLQKSYFGKVKMIYIDPPYNTGNDSFIYPDKFSESKADYEKRVGDKDNEGYMTKDGMFKKNSKENGQYHSNWLNMMMPRLYLAKNLLKQDGVIFVSIDDNEVHNLRLLMNEIFGEENFVAEFPRVTKKAGKTTDSIAKNTDYVLAFCKSDFLKLNKESFEDEGYKHIDEYENDRGKYKLSQTLDYGSIQYSPSLDYEIIIDGFIFRPGNVSREEQLERQKRNPGSDYCWRWSKDLYEFGLLNGFIVVKESSNGKRIYTKTYQKATISKDSKGYYVEIIKRTKSTSTLELIENRYSNDNSRKDLAKIFNEKVFEYSKPVSLINKLVQIGSNPNDLILDFFAGSGTTAHAVMDLNKEDSGNRKYICVQLPELCDEKSEAYKSGYKTIAEISKERIRRAGKKNQEETYAEIKNIELEIKKLQGELPTEETKTEIDNLNTKIKHLKVQDLGFKVLKLDDSNFKQWQQIEGKNVSALAEQMKLFVDPVSESATIENMVYELLLKSGKDLNSKIEKKFPSSGGVAESRGGRNAKNYFELPYNPKLKERAKELRQAGNLSEVLFWNQVKNKQFKGYDFDRQKVIGNYIVDFYCSNCNVVIEIDGSSHDNKVEYDAERDAFLESLGLTVIHVPVAEVMNNMSGVIEMLFDHPALNLTEQKEPPRPSGTPPKEGNLELTYYVVNDGELILLLEKATQEIIDTVIASKPNKVIALDKLFKGNDQLKTNTVLQMKDAGIEFKTI